VPLAPVNKEGYTLDDKHWYCVYTKPRLEHRVHKILSEKGLETFFPEMPRSRRDRRRGIRRPFFPRYLFVRMAVPKDYSWVKWTPGLLRVLQFGDQLACIEDETIAFMRERLQEETERQVQYGKFEPGERVRFVEGPFEGFEGVFDRRLSGRGRVRVLIEFLRRTTPYEVESDWLRKSDQA
jgi:transcriptional antiterminator NusG